MTESVEPQTPEEAAVLRGLAATHRRRHRWLALCWSVPLSAHATLILHTIWQDWPLDARDLGLLAFLVVNALGCLAWLAWNLRSLRESEAMDCQWKVQDVRWRAQRRARSQACEERRRPLREG
jgi:hypothetical protein